MDDNEGMPPVLPLTPPADLDAEFTRQVATLAAFVPPGFAALVEPLREHAVARPLGEAIPFVLTPSAALMPVADAIVRVERRGRAGFSVMDAEDLARFTPIEGVAVPDGPAHLALGVDLGFATRNVCPNDALPAISSEGRSVLTLEEGVALVTHFPEAVATNAGFSLVGSRCGDKRVAALWISKGAPKLGWCWAGNPHTWLGSASCEGRAGAQAPAAWASAQAMASP
jgi:hypothetical protein